MYLQLVFDVAKAVEEVKHIADIEIASKIAVVDGKKAKLYLNNFAETPRQVEGGLPPSEGDGAPRFAWSEEGLPLL